MEVKLDHTTKCYNTNTPKAIVLHVDLGTERSTRNTIFGTASASYHYYIPRHGNYYIEYVPPHKGAWHAGKKSNPNHRAQELFGDEDVNLNSISICYEGRGVDIYGNPSWEWSKVVDGELANDKQVRIAQEIIKDYDLPLFAHREITSYKPKSVLDFKDRVQETFVCNLRQFSTKELTGEIIRRYKTGTLWT